MVSDIWDKINNILRQKQSLEALSLRVAVPTPRGKTFFLGGWVWLHVGYEALKDAVRGMDTDCLKEATTAKRASLDFSNA